MAKRQIRSSFEDGNDATIAKTFVGAIFIEVKTTLLLVIEKVKLPFSKFLELLCFWAAKLAELSTPKLSVSISSVSVDGLKLVILSAYFFLNFLGAIISWL